MRGRIKTSKEKRLETELELELAASSGDGSEVVVLLRLYLPLLPSVFSAVSLGKLSILQAALDHGADPNEQSDGLSPLSLCIMASTAAPMQPQSGMPRRPNITVETGLEMVHALLSAGAIPTTEDLWQACNMNNAALGKLLLDSGHGTRLVAAGGENGSLLRVAGMKCPDLVYDLMECGASQADFGPDGVPETIDLSVFRVARWKQLRTLYLMHGRGCVPIPKHLCRLISAFLAEPLRLRSTSGKKATPRGNGGFNRFPIFAEEIDCPSVFCMAPPGLYELFPPPPALFISTLS
jgi:hypothetical protein